MGWNSIGYFNITATTAETLAQNITNCTAVAYWNTTLGRFVTHSVGTDISNFTVKKGEGALIYTKTGSVWINQ